MNDAYLGCPPPLPSVHVKVDTNFTCLISVVLLRSKEKQRRKLRISVKRPDALQDVSEIDFECFTSNKNLVTLELRSRRGKLVINDGIEFT